VNGHEVQWVTPAPLWQAASSEPAKMRAPTLLRFASDKFMDEFAALLGSRPGDLATLVADPRSYRPRPIGKPTTWTPPPPAKLKLYQPIHGHFYLLAASLVCRRAGLPDRAVDPGQEERVGFVLRRKSANGQELAWIDHPETGKRWNATATPFQRADSEELLPLFPLDFRQGERTRRLFAGLVPTASVETLKAAGSPMLVDPATGAPVDPRPQEFDQRVSRPLEALKESPAAQTPKEEGDHREASRFLLLDFADYLQLHVPAVWARVVAGSKGSLTGPAGVLFDDLDQNAVGGATWRSLLKTAWDERDRITGESPAEPTLVVNLRRTPADPRTLETHVVQALPALGAKPPPLDGRPAEEMEIPKLGTPGEFTYVLRCVYERPLCGPLHAPVVSDPSAEFQLASFFDVDAPARQIRIVLPVDTSAKTMRQFSKNVGFVMSDQLRAQMGRVRDAKAALKGELGEETSFDLGVICAFSLPIVTLVALMLLMIVVGLLNIIFWWMPLFRICLPVPVKAKP
jgi:hypothetical protein